MAAAPKTITGREALKRVLEKVGDPMKVSDLTAAALKMKGARLTATCRHGTRTTS